VDLGRDVRRLLGREQRGTGLWADAAALELLPLATLRREAATAGLTAHQADKRDRPLKLLGYAGLLREIARRTGEAEVLSKAAAAAARAAREADRRLIPLIRLEQAATARLSAHLFSDAKAAKAAGEFLKEAEAAVSGPQDELTVRRLAVRAGLEAAASLAARDLDQAANAASSLDAAVERLDAWTKVHGAGQAEAAAVRCDRADFLIGFGGRLKDKGLLTRAESDLSQLARQLDPAYLPLTWARTEALRGAALAALGDLSGDAKTLTEAVRALAAAAEHADFEHSPLDRARISHSLALALQALAEACDDDGMFDHAMGAFDQAVVAISAGQAKPLAAMIVHDRAVCVARRAERHGDAAALARAEEAFRSELASLDASADPVAWAVTQLALGRVYVAQSGLLGGELPPPQAALALTESLEVFTERGMKTLAEAAQAGLERLRAAQSAG
jgi:hypothetical protein